MTISNKSDKLYVPPQRLKCAQGRDYILHEGTGVCVHTPFRLNRVASMAWLGKQLPCPLQWKEVYTSMQMVHTHNSCDISFTPNSFTCNSITRNPVTHNSSTHSFFTQSVFRHALSLSCLSHLMSTSVGCFLEEVDMWGFPVLYFWSPRPYVCVFALSLTSGVFPCAFAILHANICAATCP